MNINFLNKKFRVYFFWKLLRFPLFLKITQNKKVYEEANSKKQISLLKKLFDFPHKVFQTFSYSLHSRNTKVDYLVFEHSRKISNNGDFIDIYSENIIEKIAKTKC